MVALPRQRNVRLPKGNAAQRERLAKFQKQLAAVTVLDPACGSGNFLYVSLQLLLGLEKEVITFATQLGFVFKPQVTVPQLKAIEINPYAFELAQVSVQTPLNFGRFRRVLAGFRGTRQMLIESACDNARTHFKAAFCTN